MGFHAYMFNSHKICAQILCFDFLTCMRYVLACSIPVGYVHKVYILTF